MNKAASTVPETAVKTHATMDIVNKGLARRLRAEKRFRMMGISAIVASLLFLSLLFISIAGNGYTAFQQTFIRIPFYFDHEILGDKDLSTADYSFVVKVGLCHVSGCN